MKKIKQEKNRSDHNNKKLTTCEIFRYKQRNKMYANNTKKKCTWWAFKMYLIFVYFNDTTVYT